MRSLSRDYVKLDFKGKDVKATKDDAGVKKATDKKKEEVSHRRRKRDALPLSEQLATLSDDELTELAVLLEKMRYRSDLVREIEEEEASLPVVLLAEPDQQDEEEEEEVAADLMPLPPAPIKREYAPPAIVNDVDDYEQRYVAVPIAVIEDDEDDQLDWPLADQLEQEPVLLLTDDDDRLDQIEANDRIDFLNDQLNERYGDF